MDVAEAEGEIWVLRLTRTQRIKLAAVLRGLGGKKDALALADAIERDGRVTRHLGAPTRSSAIRRVLRDAKGWLGRDELFARVMPLVDGDATRSLVDGSLRALIRNGEVERRAKNFVVEYRLAKARA